MVNRSSAKQPSLKKPKRTLGPGVRCKRGDRLRLLIESLERRQMLTAGAFLQGTAFVDSKGTHTLENGDAYLPGATISLYQGTSTSGAPLATTVTNAVGQYIFSDANVQSSYGDPGLNPGVYTLVETPPSGYVNDATQVLSQLNPSISVNRTTVQVTLVNPTNVYLAFDANQFFNLNEWDYLQETFNGGPNTETAGQLPIAAVNPFVFTQQYTNAGVTHGSSTIAMTNTSGFSPGEFVSVSDGTTTLY